jgi:7-cyano-7-deazaguanine synthase in queuosine biosynthesis
MINAVIPQKKKSFVLISGGLDSAACLVWMLQNTDDEVHAHHIHLKNHEGRTEAEQIAMQKILAYCQQHYRRFRYTESHMELPGFVPYDMYVYMWYAGIMVISYKGKLDRVVTGEHANPPNMQRGIDARVKRSREIFHATAGTDTVDWFMPLKDMNKQQIWDSIPVELAEISWSCRKPKTVNGQPTPCMKCHACKSLKGFKY